MIRLADLIPNRDRLRLAMVRALAFNQACGAECDYRRALQGIRHPVASARIRIAANIEAGADGKSWAVY